MAHSPKTPYWADYQKLQQNGDDAAEAIGSAAPAYYAIGLKVLGTRQQGWTACIGGDGGKNLGGLDGTHIVGTFQSDTAANLTAGVLALATMVYENRKTIAALQAALEEHGQIGTTIS